MHRKAERSAGILGFGLHDLDGDPLCTEDYHKSYGGAQSGRDGISCSCSASDFSVCQGNAAWVAVDLNLEGTGRANVMLDANVYGRCRRLAQELALAVGAPNVGSINIGVENRDPGATRFEELAALVAFASASWQTEIRWMWERRLVFTGGGKE